MSILKSKVSKAGKVKSGKEHLAGLIIAKTWANIPEHCRPSNPLSKYSTKRNANKVESMIMDFLKLSGHHCERTKTTGRLIEGQTIQRGFYGSVKTQSRWIQGTATVASSDLKAIINGRFCAIEVKHGNDKQSQSQRQYEADIITSGGVYLIAKSFEHFYDQYLKLIQDA